MLHSTGHAPILDVLTSAGADVACTARVRLPSRTSTDSEYSEPSDSGHATAFRRPVVTKQTSVRAEDNRVLVPTISRRSIGWDSNLSNESGVLINSH